MSKNNLSQLQLNSKIFSFQLFIIILNMQVQAADQGNTGIRRNGIIFAVLTLIIHVLACFMFGFFFRLPAQTTQGQFYPIFIAFAHGFFVIIGFGLLFSYLRKTIWTGLGFALLITALSVEMYFMMNAFWTKAVIWYKSPVIVQFKDQTKLYSFWLTNINQYTRFLATLTSGFRCALCNIIAFSSIIGRAGPLEALFISIFGTIGYQLNRQILANYSNDSGGTSSIFVFGGFMSLVIGIFRYLKQRNQASSTKHHLNYTASRTSAAFSLIGTLIVWIFFPILSMDYLDPNVSYSTTYTGPYAVIYSLCAATITSFIVSAILNNGLLIRDIIYGPVAGGVAASTASYWILNPVYAILIGIISAAVQVIIMNLVQRKVARQRQIFHSYSFTLFGIQGLIGAILASIWNAGVRSNTYGFSYSFPNNQVFTWIISLISAPMGALFGVLIGALCMAVASHTRQDHFDDFTYWTNDDGLRMFEGKPTLAVPTASNIFEKQRQHNIKGKQAYL